MLVLASIVLAAAVLLASRLYGTRAVFPATVVISLAAAMLFDPSFGLAPMLGLIAGLQVERQRGYAEIIVGAAVPGAVRGGWLLLSQDVQTRARLAEALTTQLGSAGLQTGEGAFGLEEMVVWVVRVQPGLEYVSLLLTALLAYRVAAWLAPRFQIELPVARPFHLWRPWDELIWGLVAALALALVSTGVLRDLGLNVGLVLGIIYVVQGLALVQFAMHRLGIARPLEYMVYLLLFFTSGVSLLLLAGLGLMDTWFDWRRLRPAITGKSPE